MTYQFRPATRERCYTLTGFAGPSGSGKTFSALRYAVGLANGGKIAMIDTEARRGLHYADQFDYLYSELAAPFTPDRYMEAIKDAEKAGAAVIIVDSTSHEHEGPGGILEMHEAELTRMAGNDFRKRENCKFAAWIKPKAQHNRFVNSILQVKAHLIFCFRAKEKLRMVKNEKGKLEPTPQGWQPICTDRLEYEMTALMVLPPNSRGIPDLSEGATKMQEQHKHIFATGAQIDEAMGAELAKWAEGDAAAGRGEPASAPDADPLIAEARAVAGKGKVSFNAWWAGLSKAARDVVRPMLAELKAIADRADAPPDEDDDNPFGLPPSKDETAGTPPAPTARAIPIPKINGEDCFSDWSQSMTAAISQAHDETTVKALLVENEKALKQAHEQAPDIYELVMKASMDRESELREEAA